MDKIFVGQTKLIITLDTGINHENVSRAEIRYIKPDGTEGAWEASVHQTDTKKIYYEVQSETDLDVAGEWKLWAYIEYADGKKAYGESTYLSVWEEGD